MAAMSPQVLPGHNLGQRHRYLNERVKQAAAGEVSFQDIAELHEHTPVDRLFKIDLANKLKNVDYILRNLKDDDMLYVSRALKCNWLVEQREIINPQYLEHSLFPEMVLPAITKFKHWLYINLRDQQTCQEFYQHYKETKFDFAVKFLQYCADTFLLSEFPKILVKINPHHLKVLGEKCPKLIKIYFDSLASNNELVKRYLNEENSFYASIKSTLKLDPDTYFEIMEKYQPLTTASKLSPLATDYILRHHKSRFLDKQELYVAHLVHLPTLAQRLSAEECEDVLMKLARADYLSWWFSYANVEPLFKRISRDKRAAFKKRIFVEKNVGDRIAEWPYVLPASPVAKSCDDEHVFDDQEYEPIRKGGYMFLQGRYLKRGYAKCSMRCEALMDCCVIMKSELEKLFDEFRVAGFKETLHELRTRISASSSADTRRNMLLVLVSKSGGRADSVAELLELALRLRNEPVHERAAVVRSLAKRASSWRLPQNVWDAMLQYSHGLGLDGTKPEAECREGLHAVVIRQLLASGECEAAVRTAFLEDFTTLADYKLAASERPVVAAGLQRILLAAAAEAEPKAAASRLNQLLDVLVSYSISFGSSSVVPAVTTLAERDSEVARPLLVRLYEARVGRRELLRQYLKFRHDDAALSNALRHDPDALDPQWLVKLLIDGKTRANQFFLKLAVYFKEEGGTAERLRQVMQDEISKEPNVRLGRPLATLAGSDMTSLWLEQDTMCADRRSPHYKLSAVLRANMHRARPAPDAVALGWRTAGLKAVAWRATRCRPALLTQLIQSLLQERTKRTVRLALALAPRTNSELKIFQAAVTIRPLATLRAALYHFRRLGDSADPRIWELVKPWLFSVDLTSRWGLREVLRKEEWVPRTIKPDYCALLYLALDKVSDNEANCILLDLMKYLPEISDDLTETLLLLMLKKLEKEDPESYPAMIIRYLMLSKSDQELKIRLEKIGEPFLVKILSFRNTKHENSNNFFQNNLDQILSSLQYNFVFFDSKYQCCLPVMEVVLSWMLKFLPREKFFGQYIKIHAAMLYYKTIRQSIKQRPEVFRDPAKKVSEGVDVVGYNFGRYIVKELAELQCKYFISVIEIYCCEFGEYLNNFFTYSASRNQLVAALAKCIVSESVGGETRLAIEVLQRFKYNFSDSDVMEIKNLFKKCENKETQFFYFSEIINY